MTPPKVLYLDDEFINLELLKIMFSHEFDIITAITPSEALQIVHTTPDLVAIITDMKMPQMSGLQFIEKARKKPWFDNTIFVIVADHCASSAGKWEINIEKHHIPALILNAHKNLKVDKLCSQIDLMPSVFSLMNWSYETQFYGNNIFKTKNADERALIGNYRTLGMLKDTTFVEVNDRKEIKTYRWNADLKSMTLSNTKNNFLEKKTIAYYQTASERYKNGKMKNLK